MEWIPITKQMPKLLSRVIFFHPENTEVNCGVAMTSGIMVEGYMYACSHWMPLPEPPNYSKEDLSNDLKNS